MTVKFNNNYASLPEHFYEVVKPTLVKNPHLVLLNEQLAKDLQIDLSSIDTANIFSGNVLVEGSKPIALAYGGHQYGYFVPQLGDGRAILLGDISDVFGNHFEVQLKGAGQTRFSRQSDGRLPLGPAIREYIISEFMHSINIPTTRSLAVVTTGEMVMREKLLPSAVLTRISKSHVRIGTFEYFAARGDVAALRLLADYMIKNYYPTSGSANNPYEALLQSIIDAQAYLIAKWSCVGFIHGVMNTDNTSIVGETIDYGPCAFMDAFDPDTVFSSIDRHGRYAYANQAEIAQWNLTMLAKCFIPILSNDINEAIGIAQEAIASFMPAYERYWLKNMGVKIGIPNPHPNDSMLINDLLDLMYKYHVDFTLSFRCLSQVVGPKSDAKELKNLFNNGRDFSEWLKRWQVRLGTESRSALAIESHMNSVNPLFIPRNHVVEQAIELAINENDFTAVNALIQVLSNPYTDRAACDKYKSPVEASGRVYKTFCGT